jgi:hypothetical protein
VGQNLHENHDPYLWLRGRYSTLFTFINCSAIDYEPIIFRKDSQSIGQGRGVEDIVGETLKLIKNILIYFISPIYGLLMNTMVLSDGSQKNHSSE